MTEQIPSSEREHLRVTVYTPESGIRQPFQLFKGMLSDAFCRRSRDFAWRIFIRDTAALYRQSILGYLWVLIPPVLTAFVWVFLNRSKVLSVTAPAGVPYSLYTLTGNLIWQGTTLAMLTPIHMLQREKGTLTKINVPREGYLVAGFLQALLNAGIPMLLLIPIMLYFRVTPSVAMIPGLLAFIGGVLASYTVGVMLTPVGLLYTDVAKGLPIITKFWFFVTPIAFAIPAAGWSRTIFLINPATSFLDISRSLILGTAPNPTLLPIFAGYMAATVFVLLFSLILYRLSMPIIIERMSA